MHILPLAIDLIDCCVYSDGDESKRDLKLSHKIMLKKADYLLNRRSVNRLFLV